MAKLDPHSYRSIREYVERQARIEDDLIAQYAGKPKKSSARDDTQIEDEYAHLPPEFVPILDRFPDSYKKRSGHTTITVNEFVGHRRTSQRQHPIEITGSDHRGVENGRHQMARQGLCNVEDINQAKRAIAEKFNASFADHGDIIELITKLNRLPSMVIGSGIAGVDTAPFDGQLEIVVDPPSREAILANPFLKYKTALNHKGYFPTFTDEEIRLDFKNQLSPEAMLTVRDSLTRSLGLPLHSTDDEIEKAWTGQLEAAYDLWKTQTTELLESKGVDIKLPPFDAAMKQQKIIDGISNSWQNPRQQDTGLER